MEMSMSIYSGRCDVMLQGSFTFADNATFKQVIQLVDDPEVRSFDINFSKVDFIDSAVLGMLMILRTESARNGQSVTIRGARGQVEKVMRMSQFDSKFMMVD